ncbi:MAG: right-handed parallel beta-helix repeat-containing protein [Candidatus Thiothrix putei]|uniref:Right-handed parallel beta-helix repeat-containing protein n=1 Tax=Candidatus Thiothrix putei TaxID=3080811 RepID=A0AA95KSU6_9GAMM|nr:MAG: right-handed parallel beta-helix repeat-containing protein [Candidatus Thiothrix putei]
MNSYNNVIDNTGYTGGTVCLQLVDASPTVQGNLLTQCAYGLALAGHSNPLVNNGNRIVHNSSIGIWNDANYKATAAEVPFPVINGNAIHDNGSYNYYPYRWYYYPNLAQVDLNARENWWGTTDELEIRNKIYDYEDAGNSLPNVDFGNYLSSAEAEPAPLTPLNGTLAANTTLTAEHPYYVSETVTVPANKTLTVPAGSKLLFASGAGITVQAGGHLVMQGSASSPVVLGSADTDNQAGDWEGIKAEAGATVSLEHVQASEYTSMDFQNGSVTIRHSRFGKFSGYGLLLTGTDGLLANNVIDNTGYTGGTVCLQLVDASPTVQGNLLTQCAYGLALAGHSNPLVNNGNRIVHNSSIGIWNDANYKATAAEVPFPVINGNAIHDNGSYNYYPYRWYYYPNLAQVDLNARENWWGTTDEAAIRAKIYDYEDTYALPHVNSSDYLLSPIAGGGDNQPPTITSISDHAEIRLGTLVVNATDNTGIKSVDFLLDDKALTATQLSQERYQVALDYVSMTAGDHVLTVTVHDYYGNRISKTINLVVDFLTPESPVIEQPADGSELGHSDIQVMGTALYKLKALITVDDNVATNPVDIGGEGQTNTVRLFLDNSPLGGAVAVGSYGTFQQIVNIPSPGGTLTAKLVTSLGTESTASAAHTIAIDNEGPSISSVIYSGEAFVDNTVISQSGDISVTTSDAVRMELALDGNSLAIDTNSSDGFVFPLHVGTLADGAHLVAITAYDRFDNVTVLNIPFSLTLAAPAAPVLTTPANDLVTNQTQVKVTGTAEPSVTVSILVNGVSKADAIVVSATGTFQADIPLSQGTNTITAIASNKTGQSPASSAVTVTVDPTIPEAPVLSLVSNKSGEVQLQWNTVDTEPKITGYQVYRATNSFADLADAVQLTPTVLTSNTYTDLPDIDGNYYYRVVAINALDTLSIPSNEVYATVDSTAPKVLAVHYQTDGVVDQTGGRFGIGKVTLDVELSEAVANTPFFSITPTMGSPIPILLKQVSDTHYKGSFDITSATPSGTAHAVFSASDLLGNRGTQITQGKSIVIDTMAPKVVAIKVTPGTPIKNNAVTPQTITAVFEFDESVKAGTQPNIAWMLSSTGDAKIPITHIEQVQEKQWRASFTLPASTGQSGVDTLSFTVETADTLGNSGSKIAADNAFQIYQDKLPPLGIPQHLVAISQLGGKVTLSWDVVPGASDYQLYRVAAGEPELTPLIRSGNVTNYVDQTSVDGNYHYAIASIYTHNGEESVSAISPVVNATVDSTPPSQPQNLTLELTAQGIMTRWDASTDAGKVHYRLYRSDLAEITSVEGLIPIVDNIEAFSVLDMAPSQNAHTYAVTAVDEAGNESEPSVSVYLNFALLPVTRFSTTQTDGQQPVLTWFHASPESVDGYKITVTSPDSPKPVELDQHLSNRYTDSGYTVGERIYSIVAYDSNGAESLKRSLTLPSLSVTLNDGVKLNRGLLNRLIFTVNNTGSSAVDAAELEIKVKDHIAHSAPFSVAPGESQVVEVILPGYTDLDPVSTLLETIRLKPDETSSVEIAYSQDITVTDTALTMTLATKAFTRGASGEIQFTLKNSSDVQVELVTGLNGGQTPSPDIAVKLLDQNGNVLSSQAFAQFSGAEIVTLSDGTSIAKIPAGATFTSQWFPMLVPAASPNTVKVQLEISKLHHDVGKANAVSLDINLQARRDTSLSDTSYYGDIKNISPSSSFGEVPIEIGGRAINRYTGLPESVAPLKLVIAANGFERVANVTTDASGNFTYQFSPLPSESGQYQVSVIHPDMLERPQQGQFAISKVLFNYSTLDLRIPRRLIKEIPLELKAGNATSLTGLVLDYKAADQPSGVLAKGVTVTIGDIPDIQSGQTVATPVSIQGSDTANDTGTLVLALRSAVTGSKPLASVMVNYSFSNAEPFLAFEPAHLTTGVVFDSSVSEKIDIKNAGLAPLEKLQLNLLTKSGGAVPAWIKLISAVSLDSLPVGEKYTAQIQASPNNTVAEGVHEFILRATSANFQTVNIPLSITVTQAGKGSVAFNVSDIYTATRDKEGNLIQGVSNASIKLINEKVGSIENSLNTDNTGEALFQDVPAGIYQYRISADKHQDKTGQIQIKPGTTVVEEVFLEYRLVTVEWSVNEITLHDNYEITLEATYETDVPAAVVVVNPVSVTLPDLEKGDVYNGEFKITNQGLIRADNLKVTMPQDDQFFDYEMLDGIPETLDAKQSITVPYRAVMKQSFTPDGSGSGGGCVVYQQCGEVAATSECANGETSNTSSPYCVTHSSGNCSSSAGSGGNGGSAWSFYGGGYGGYGGYSYSTEESDSGSGMIRCRGNNDCGGATGNGAN